MNSELQIIPYKKWMKEEIIAMFNSQYSYSEGEFEAIFDSFYEADYQRDKCIRIVALDNNKVVGFQSFFYWPYTYNNKVYNVYQSGNSIVHSLYRGKGIFGKLLNYIDDQKEQLNIDFLIGFPVEQSYNSFIRKGWTNPFNLQWQIKKINALSLIIPFSKKALEKQLNNVPFKFTNEQNVVSLLDSDDFRHYRSMYTTGIYFNHLYESGRDFVHFQLKVNIRKKVIKELIIGQVHFSSSSSCEELLSTAFKDLTERVKKSKSISLISFAFPNNTKIYTQALSNNKFTKLDKGIYFICQGIPKEIEDQIEKGSFLVHRADIDTW